MESGILIIIFPRRGGNGSGNSIIIFFAAPRERESWCRLSVSYGTVRHDVIKYDMMRYYRIHDT